MSRRTTVADKKAWRNRTRSRAIVHLGGSCSCGSVEELQFDHIDKTTKAFTISEAIRDGWAWDRILAELSKCQLLCGPCHRLKSSEETLVPHGGGVSGRTYGTGKNRKRCKCDPCRLKHNAYVNEHKKRSRARARVAQLVERNVANVEVAGS